MNFKIKLLFLLRCVGHEILGDKDQEVCCESMSPRNDRASTPLIIGPSKQDLEMTTLTEKSKAEVENIMESHLKIN